MSGKSRGRRTEQEGETGTENLGLRGDEQGVIAYKVLGPFDGDEIEDVVGRGTMPLASKY